MTDRDIMQQALEVMGTVGADHICEASHHAKKDRHKLGEPCPLQQRWHIAYQALFERLAQPVQEPSADEVIASHAKRLALTLEALLLSCEQTAVVSKWWSSAHMALGQYQDDVDRLYPQDHISPLGKD